MFTQKISLRTIATDSIYHSANTPAEPRQEGPLENSGTPANQGFNQGLSTNKKPLLITHKNHKNINQKQFDEIIKIDHEIHDIVNHPTPQKTIELPLSKLLESSFFQSQNVINQERMRLFNELNACPIFAYNNEHELSEATYWVDRHTQHFIEGHKNLKIKYAHDDDLMEDTSQLENAIKEYLQSNRSDRAYFESELNSSLELIISNGSAQKMALETFSAAFRHIQTGDPARVRLLKQLIDTLPKLEYHENSLRSPQQRGLEVLDKALGNLMPNQKSEVLIHLMNTVGQLNHELSQHRGFFGAPKFGDAAMLSEIGLAGSAASYGTYVSIVGAASVGLAATVAFPVAGFAIPATLLGAAYLNEAPHMQKQAQGTGLILLKNQLAQLRKDWSQVTPENRQQLIDAFAQLKGNIHNLSNTKHKTLKQLFNDGFIDPVNFGKTPLHGAEIRKRLRHQWLAPITSRLKPLNFTGIQKYDEATLEQKDLVDLLLEYHSEASDVGVKNTDFPSNFLANFIENTNKPEFEDAPSVVYEFFDRISETPEYKNNFTKPIILNTVIEMTRRLADGDKDFIQEFVSVSQGASEDCHNNARQFLKILTNAVITDKAAKGEDGLDNYDSLLNLGRGFYHEEVLKSVTREVITHKIKGPEYPAIEVEIGCAVEIALGDQFNIPNAVKGMSYTDIVHSIVTPDILKTIEAEVKHRVYGGDAAAIDQAASHEPNPVHRGFIDYLMNWTPLTHKIEEDPEFKNQLDKIISQAREHFNTAYESFEEIANPTPAHIEAFEAAGIECRATESGAHQHLLRQFISELVRRASSQGDWRHRLMDELREATPITDAWLKEHDFVVLPNHGDSNGCLILSLLQHSPTFANDRQLLVTTAHKIREQLVSLFPQVSGNDMLEVYSGGDDAMLQALTTLVQHEWDQTQVDAKRNVERLNPLIVVPSISGRPALSGSDDANFHLPHQRHLIIYGRNGNLHFEAVTPKSRSVETR